MKNKTKKELLVLMFGSNEYSFKLVEYAEGKIDELSVNMDKMTWIYQGEEIPIGNCRFLGSGIYLIKSGVIGVYTKNIESLNNLLYHWDNSKDGWYSQKKEN